MGRLILKIKVRMITYLRSILYKNMKLLQGILNSLRPAVVAMIGSAGILILISVFWGSAEQIALVHTN